MLGRDFDENDLHAVRISEPQLDQPPGFLFRLPLDGDLALLQLLGSCLDVADLEPEGTVEAPRQAGTTVRRYLEKRLAREEYCACTVFPVDRKTEIVSIEGQCALVIDGSQDCSSTEYFHTYILHHSERTSRRPMTLSRALPCPLTIIDERVSYLSGCQIRVVATRSPPAALASYIIRSATREAVAMVSLLELHRGESA